MNPGAPISWREFVVGSTLAGVGLGMGNVAAAGASQEAATGSSGWFERPMRWAQLTLVENDPGRFDPAFWLEYFKRIHADA
jgi:hypothetical protein